MPNLRDLVPITPVSSVFSEKTIAVWNTNIENQNNGGQCCCWVVPAGTTYAIFEVWSAGGDGGGACCCMGPYWGPGTGQYAKKRLPVTAGCFFTICAAGSGCQTCACCGNCGFPSWVNCGAGGNAICVQGGQMGCTLCFRSYQGCTGICVPACVSSCGASGHDLGIPTVGSPNKQSNWCWVNMWDWNTGAPGLGNSTRNGYDYCTIQLTRSGCDTMGSVSKFPSGSGTNARACGGGCCFGSWGAGGIVVVTYG